MHNIIIIDDDPDYRQLVCTFLAKIFPDTRITEYDPIAEGVPDRNFDWSKFDCLILDYYLCIQNFTGLDLLKREQTNPYFPASIMLTGAGNEEIAARSLRFGANKYISKQGLTKGLLRESIEEAWQKHQDNLRIRKLIERRNRTFNKTRFYQNLEATSAMDFSNTTRCMLSIELASPASGKPLDLITRNNILKHVALICFRFLSVKHQDLCITTLTDNSLALLIDFQQEYDHIKAEIKALQKENINKPWHGKDKEIKYSLATAAILINESGTDNVEISRQFRETCARARSMPDADNNILIHWITAVKNDPSPQVEAPVPETTKEVHAEAEPAAQVADTSVADDTGTEITASDQAPESAVIKDTDNDTDRKDSSTGSLTPSEPVATEGVSSSSKYEVYFDESRLSEHDKKVIEALDEHRILQVFQPIMIINTEIFDFDDMFHVSLRMVDKVGDEESAQEVFSTQENPEVSKYIDRWMIKEVFGFIVDAGAENQNQMFMIKLSHHSLSDTTLFNWLRELLSGIDNFNPGESITLEISISYLLENQKKVTALIQFLSKTYGFRFTLGHINNTDEIKQIVKIPGIRMLMLDSGLMHELKKIPADEGLEDNFVNYLKQKKLYLITRNINDSTELMDAISAGADFAMGEFIGIPQTEFDESTNIESYDLDNGKGSYVY